MDLTRYVDELRSQLLTAAEAGGEDARLLADRLVAPLQAAAHLVLLDALSAAANEITSDLAPGSVEVRLRGRDPEFVVTSPTANRDDTAARPTTALVSTAAATPAGDAEDGGTARVTLRLPEPLKVRIEEAAGQEGLSVNSWLVRILAGVVGSTERQAPIPRRMPTGGDRFTGWTRP